MWPAAAIVRRLDREHDRLAAAAADLSRGLDVGREVDVMALALHQPRLANRRQRRARWCRDTRHPGGVRRRQVELDLDRVALVRADPRAVRREREALLVGRSRRCRRARRA